jgi:hypothetical protein
MPSRQATPLRASRARVSTMTWASPVASSTRSKPPISAAALAAGVSAWRSRSRRMLRRAGRVAQSRRIVRRSRPRSPPVGAGRCRACRSRRCQAPARDGARRRRSRGERGVDRKAVPAGDNPIAVDRGSRRMNLRRDARKVPPSASTTVARGGCPLPTSASRRLTRNRGFAGETGAGATGLEPATSGVTGRRSNQLSYAPVRGRPVKQGGEPRAWRNAPPRRRAAARTESVTPQPLLG